MAKEEKDKRFYKVYNIKGIEKDNKKIINSSFSANAEKEFVSGESESEDVAPVQTEGVKECKEVGVSGTNDKEVLEEIEIPEWGRKSDWEYFKSVSAPRYMGDALGF